MGPRARRGRFAVALLAALLTVAATGAASRGGSATPFLRLTQPHHADGKLDSSLARIAPSSRAGGVRAALAVARTHGVSVSGKKVRVIVQAKPGRTKAVRSLLGAVGATTVAAAGGLSEALVWPGSLGRLSSSSAVAELRTPARPFAAGTGSGTPTAAVPVDEGIAATSADAWHAAGFDGTGVKVAIVDVGFFGYAALLGSALPASVTTIDHCGGRLAASPAAGGTEHGTAVAEVVHQMAPGAELYLICMDSEVGLAQAEQDAVSAGVKVIDHSVGWLNTSRGDGSGLPGTPDAIVADARAHGILWVNSAGDDATGHWSGPFKPFASDATVHDFGFGDPLDTLTLPSGQEVCAYLKWDNWPTTTEDFDLLLVYEGAGTVVESSENDQSGGPEEPTEALCYTNSGPTRKFGVAIVRFSAVGNPRFDLYVTGSAPQFKVAAGSVVEPASSPRALAVGSACWALYGAGNTPDDGSARGPTIDGRPKPDLAAPAAVSTVTYGSSGGTCNAGFRGTSAAAPHVAGAAALMLDRSPSLTPAAIETSLETIARSRLFQEILPDAVGSGNLWLSKLTPTGVLAFSNDPFTTQNIWVVNEDGSGLQPVAVPPPLRGYADPSWSPDGSKLAFTNATQFASPYGVYTVNADGSNLAQVTLGRFSNAGWVGNSKLTFDDGDAIRTVNTSGTGLTKIRDGQYPAWSPDGAHVAYMYPLSLTQLWIADADGGNPHQVTSPPFFHVLGPPAWSPDGTTIAFVRDTGDVWVANGNGTNPRFLANGTRPQWSADGSRLLVVRLTVSGTQLVTVAPDGTQPEIIGRNIGFQTRLSWKSQPTPRVPAPSFAPGITGNARVGATLHADTGKWSASPPMTATVAWSRCNASGFGCTKIPGATDTSYRPSAADAGATVRAAVTVSNPAGTGSSTSDASVVIAGVAGLPGTPTNVTATPGFGQASVSFTPPASNGGSPISGYTVVSSPGGQVATGTAGPLTVTGLTHQAYTFTVTATNLTGEGLPSAPSNSVAPFGVPDAPTGVTATAGDGRATVAFTAPASDGGAAILYYTATASPGGQSASSAGGPITVGGLANGVSQTFTVRAVNAAGSGVASSPSSPVTPAGAERPHADPPAQRPRADVPPFVAPGRRPPPPACGACF